MLEHYLGGVDADRAVRLLAYAVDDPHAIAVAFGRGDRLRYDVLRSLASTGLRPCLTQDPVPRGG